MMAYTTTPILLQTVAAVAVPTAQANGTATSSRPALPEFTGAANNVLPSAFIAFTIAIGAAASLF